MKRTALLVLLLCTGLLAPVSAFDLQGFKVDPKDQVMVTLLAMVVGDLDMCARSLQPSARNEISAIGHLNDAQSALKKANLDPAYLPLVGELLGRIGKVKFYLVMQDFNGSAMRLSQLIGVIRSVLGVQGGYAYPGSYGNGSGYGNGYGNGNGNYPNGGSFYPTGQGQNITPMRPTEIPVGGAPGQNVAPGLPSLGVPVN